MPGRSETPFLHVTLSENGAAAVRKGLQLVGREEDVEYFFDDLAVGPLHDVDRGAAARAAWWRRLDPATKFPRSRPIDDAPIWKRIVEDSRNVVLWDGPHPSEHIYAIRGCWFLRETPSRVFEVRLPPHESADLPDFYGAVGIVGPDGVAAAWPTLRLVSPGDVDARAQEWIDLQRQGGEGFRELREGRIVELPITAHDDALIEACSKGWTSSTLIIARVLSMVPSGDVVLSWRVRELIDGAKLEGRGETTRLGLPNEIRLRST